MAQFQISVLRSGTCGHNDSEQDPTEVSFLAAWHYCLRKGHLVTDKEAKCAVSVPKTQVLYFWAAAFSDAASC